MNSLTTSSNSFFSETKDENSFVACQWMNNQKEREGERERERERDGENEWIWERDRESLEALRIIIAKTLKKLNTKLHVFQK